jgi:hypothetical protein
MVGLSSEEAEWARSLGYGEERYGVERYSRYGQSEERLRAVEGERARIRAWRGANEDLKRLYNRVGANLPRLARAFDEAWRAQEAPGEGAPKSLRAALFMHKFLEMFGK